MIECVPDPSWQSGRFKVVFSSAAAHAEWTAFQKANPKAAQRAYERLSSEPLTRIPGRQFQLRGKKNRPFWEYEATGAFRVYYAADILQMTVIIGARNDVHTGADVGALIRSRRQHYDLQMIELGELISQKTDIVAESKQRRKKKPK